MNTPDQQQPSPEHLQRIVQQGAYILTAFHRELAKDKNSRHTEFWRKEAASFRHNIKDIYGSPTAITVAELVQKHTGLQFP